MLHYINSISLTLYSSSDLLLYISRRENTVRQMYYMCIMYVDKIQHPQNIFSVAVVI